MSKIAVFIGRFQPFHLGHKFIVNNALALCDKVYIFVGSATQPRSARNPFTFRERHDMIMHTFNFNKNLVVLPLVDHMYNDTLWANQIRNDVKVSKDDQVFLIGHRKDHSSYYLDMFPEWESICVDNYKLINATDIRKSLYKNYHTDWKWGENLPKEVMETIRSISHKTIDALIEEHNFIETYKNQWKDTKYPVIFTTVDAVVTMSGHVLMVVRGAHPGKGTLALPGGFIKPYETLRDAMIRELFEETRIAVPRPALIGSIKNEKVFDNPYRSQRGRTITTGFHIELNPKMGMPKIKGGDDAEKAIWIPLNTLERQYVYEDHADIVEWFTGVSIN